jgi:hypothetical protein
MAEGNNKKKKEYVAKKVCPVTVSQGILTFIPFLNIFFKVHPSHFPQLSLKPVFFSLDSQFVK